MRWWILFALALLSAAPSEAQETARTLAGRHVEVTYTPALEKYAKAFLRVGDSAWEAYRDLYALPLPVPLHITMRRVTGRGDRFASLWTDGQSHIFLEVGSVRPLLPPGRGGAHNVYGLCHEMGHIIFYSRMRQTAGMPPGIGEGWAVYLGSVVTDRLYASLGARVYPEPHDYRTTSGTPRLRRDIARCRAAGKWDDETKAAKVLDDVEQRYGRKALGAVLAGALATHPSGGELVPRFVESLAAVTEDPQSKTLVPPEFLALRMRVSASEPDITKKALYAGLKLEWRVEELRLRYDRDERAGQGSIAGSGHAVLFRRPEGRWQITAVEFYGCRYGGLDPPAQAFTVFLCDAKLRPVRTCPAPYARFPIVGEWRWERIALEPLDAPEFFYVVLAFEPSAEQGIYVGRGLGSFAGHSRSAFPGSHLDDAPGGGDWMVRCCLRPLDPETAPDRAKRLQSEVDALP